MVWGLDGAGALSRTFYFLPMSHLIKWKRSMSLTLFQAPYGNCTYPPSCFSYILCFAYLRGDCRIVPTGCIRRVAVHAILTVKKQKPTAETRSSMSFLHSWIQNTSWVVTKNMSLEHNKRWEVCDKVEPEWRKDGMVDLEMGSNT